MKQITVKFKTQKAAEEFLHAFASSGGDASIQESADSKTVTISSTSARTMSFVREVIRDMHESANCRKHANRLLDAISEAVMNDSPSRVALMDGGEVALTPRNARLLANLHDMLNESRQSSFLVFACESKASHEHALGFAITNERD